MVDELIEFKRSMKEPTELVALPDITLKSLHQAKKYPQMVVDVLLQCDGDIEEYIKQFYATDHKSKMTILTNTFLILDKPGNEKLREQWDAIIAAYKQSKVAMAERAALEWIGNYAPPSATAKVPMAVAISFMRTWLGEHISSETTRGRQKGMERPSKAAGVSDIMKQLQGDK